MKILLGLGAKYLPAHGGAQRNCRCLMEALAARGHTCRVLAFGPEPGVAAQAEFRSALTAAGGQVVESSAQAQTCACNGVEVQVIHNPLHLREHLVRHLRDFDPDWTLIAEDWGNLLEAAREVGLERFVYLAQSSINLPFGPLGVAPNSAKAELFRQIGGVVTPSHYLQQYVQRWGGRDDAAVLPFLAYGAGPFSNYGQFERGYVTLINPCAIKGLPIFLELAWRLPEIAFAAVPTWGTTAADRAALEALPNVTLLPATDNVDEIYAQTRVLLVPSLIPEAFGAIAVEAMLRGIPVLASNLGGLPEAKLGVDYLLPARPVECYEDRLDDRLLPVAVVPEQEAGPWEAALREVLSNRQRYACLSTESRQAADEFFNRLSVEPYERYLESLASQPREHRAAEADLPTEDQASDRLERLSPERRALLARRLRKAGGEAAAQPSIPRAPRHSAADTFPLSFAQQRLWFLNQFEPGNPFYNEHYTFRLRGLLDGAALRQALTDVIRRHEILRTAFPTVEGEPRQVISPPFEIELPLDDLGALPVAEREAEALRRARAESTQPFDLSSLPLIRARLFHLGQTEHILMLTLHHIVSDGWSGTLLAREVPALYLAHLTGEPALSKVEGLPDLPLQYGDYACWQRETWATGEHYASALAYWKRQLAGAPQALELPTDRARPPRQTFRGALRHFRLPDELAQAVKQLSRQSGVTPFMLLFAAFNALLQRYTGQDDILVGSPIAGRNWTEVEGLIGCFLNTLVLRTDLSGDPAFGELVQRVRAVTLGAYAHQDFPFEKLVDELHLARDLSRNPLFQVLFVFQAASALNYEIPGFVMEFLELRSETAKFDLTFSVTDIGQSLLGVVEYNTDLFDAVTVERMVQHWETLLAGAVADPQRRLSELPLLSQVERRQLLVEWNTANPKFSPWSVESEACMSVNPNDQAKSSQAQHIAGELHDPEQIQRQIQAQTDKRPGITTDFVPPRTPMEIKLAGIWAEVLGLEQVGIHDDFFELGGHSLLATQILSRLSQELGRELPMELIFTNSFTVAELAKAIAQLQIEQADPQELEAMLEKLSQLSEEEARQLLAHQTEGS